MLRRQVKNKTGFLLTNPSHNQTQSTNYSVCCFTTYPWVLVSERKIIPEHFAYIRLIVSEATIKVSGGTSMTTHFGKTWLQVHQASPAPILMLTCTPRAHLSTQDHTPTLSAYKKDEIREGRQVEPLPHLVTGVHISPTGLIPKAHQQEKWRWLITNLSPPQTPKWMTVLCPVYDTVLISWASSGTRVITRQRCPHGKIWSKDGLLNSAGPPWQPPSPRNMLRWSSYPTSSLTFRTPIIPNYSQWKMMH